MTLFELIKAKIRGEKTLADLEKLGFKHGKRLHLLEGVIIDPGHCMLISVGDDVTMAPRCHILAHDASTKMYLGYTRIAETFIGNRVFLGAGTIVMPGVTIGDDVIVGAGSVVTRDLDSNSVYAGVPAKRLSSIEEYISRMRSKLDETVSFDSTYAVDVASQDAMKELVDTVHSMGGSGFIE